MYNTIYPNYVRPYSGVKSGLINKKADDEKNSQSSQQAENNLQQASQGKKNVQQGAYFPNGEKVAIDYTKHQINIEQVLKDFRNTANAIGSPDDIKEEVEKYLELIQNQSQKLQPNPQVIQSNLRNASQILDEYISNTLKKPSKVVENWVDALFLQQIDYKMPVKEQVDEPVVQLEENVPDENISENVSQPVNEGIHVPSDPMLKRLFIQAKKYSVIGKNEKALYAFQTAMDYAHEIGDEQTCAMINFEEGQIYDKTDNINDALFHYDRAAKQTKDNNLKAKSYMRMGKIYDDFVKFEPAVDHYTAAAAFAGESDNLSLQTKVLSDIAQLHAERYDKKNSLLFMGMSDIIAGETGNEKVKGIIANKNGNSCEKLSEYSRALSYYGKSAGAYSKTDDASSLAKNYQAAALIMLKYGNVSRAKTLLSKAFVAAQGTDDFRLKQEISSNMAKMSEKNS